MEAIVNHQYNYILFYSAKAGCTSLRSLYLELHNDEMSQAEIASLDGYHNLHEVHPFDVTQKYSGYFKFLITRNPYTRIVSAFLDQYAYIRNSGVQAMLEKVPPEGKEPINFIDFLHYLKTVPDELRDPHFQTQSYFVYDNYFPKRRNIFKRGRMASKMNYQGDIAELNQHLHETYRKIFSSKPTRLALANEKIDELQKMNSSFYSKQDFSKAAEMPVQELNKMIFPPRPQDFYASQEAQDLIGEIYADDFIFFNYSRNDLPLRQASSELNDLPEDFDWQTYLLISPDLQLAGMTSERQVIRHYLEFGRYEAKRGYKIEAPEGFMWQQYLEINRAKIPEEIDNEYDALIHYLGYGVRQDLQY